MHRDAVTQRDVLPQIVPVEHHPRFVGETFGGNPIGVGVDSGDSPPVAVADLIDAVAEPVPGPGAPPTGPGTTRGR